MLHFPKRPRLAVFVFGWLRSRCMLQNSQVWELLLTLLTQLSAVLSQCWPARTCRRNRSSRLGAASALILLLLALFLLNGLGLPWQL